MDSLVLEIKSEIESAYNVKINISDCFNSVEHHLKARGVNVSQKHLKAIKNNLEKKNKKEKGKKYCLASSLCSENPEYEIGDFNTYYEAKVYGKKDKDKKDDEEVHVPAKLAFGVTMMLVGVFLFFLPIPACKPWGEGLILSGITMCGDCLAGKIDEDEKEKR